MRAARFLLAAMTAAGILLYAVFSAAFPRPGPAPRSFSIDGERYLLIPSVEDDSALVRGELKKIGIEPPPDPEEDPSPHPALSFAIEKAGTDRSGRRFPIPPSFGIGHTLRLAGDGEEVEIAFGSTGRSLAEAVRRLRSRGWSCAVPADRTQRGIVATYHQGKERLLAFLEAEEGGFLLVRRMDR